LRPPWLDQAVLDTMTMSLALLVERVASAGLASHPGQTMLSQSVAAATTLGHPLIHPKSQPAMGGQI